MVVAIVRSTSAGGRAHAEKRPYREATTDIVMSPLEFIQVRLLKWVFDIDIEQCPQCGGTLKFIAIEPVITKILSHPETWRLGPPKCPDPGPRTRYA